MSAIEDLRKASSLKDLAKLLSFKASTLSFVLYKEIDARKYREFFLPKKSGGLRKITAPVGPVKTLQRNLANLLYTCRDEIELQRKLPSLSHGFRRGHSIVTNAQCHTRRRYVLNIDLADFFPSFNFGRVRGFLIKNNDFALNDKVATVIAQIACHQNQLPQGSPCSPIIADLIAHVLDVRLVRLSKQHKVTYSRYADDLTFSTNKKDFPEALAKRGVLPGSDWNVADDLESAVTGAGHAINSKKTRMQCRASRQLVTGLTVNRKANIRAEFYRRARAMCHSLFAVGSYHRPSMADPRIHVPETKMAPLEGIMSHIQHVKELERNRLGLSANATAFQKLHIKLLKYKYFVSLERPVVLCEGPTDNIYLKYAVRALKAFHPKLGSWNQGVFRASVSFFSYDNQAHRLLGITGGTGPLKNLILNYQSDAESFRHRPMKHPVILLIDNDQGADGIFSVLKNIFKISIDKKTSSPFYHVVHNLYVVKTPESATNGTSYIESFFSPTLLATKLDGKDFNPDKKHQAPNEYGKRAFAESVVRPAADAIDFSRFDTLLARVAAVVDHYVAPSKGSAAP